MYLGRKARKSIDQFFVFSDPGNKQREVKKISWTSFRVCEYVQKDEFVHKIQEIGCGTMDGDSTPHT